MSISASRRSFFKQTAVLSAAGMVLPACESTPLKQVQIPERLRILFQGDSITDANRDRSSIQSNDFLKGMGNGYALLAASNLLVDYPTTDWHYYNRGVSGDKVFQLSDRWEKDCLDLQPDVLSIHIGVNDFWHTLTHDYKGTVETYEKDFLKLLERTQTNFPKIKFIIGEPFVVLGGTSIDTEAWIPTFRAYQKTAADIATQMGATFIPYQQIFDAAVANQGVTYWCPDGVHPSLAGSALMAKAWIEALHKAYL
jgi:lysophospholipase L1-like esterase